MTDHTPTCAIMFHPDSVDHGPCNCRKAGVYVLFTRNYDGSQFRQFVSSIKQLQQIMVEECADYEIDPTQENGLPLVDMEAFEETQK